MSEYLSLPKRSEDQARRDMGRISDRDFYIKLAIANEFEKLATEIRFGSHTAPTYTVALALEQRASRLRGELQREADRQSADRDDDTKPYTAYRGTE